jgi:antitoxin VapB
VPGIISTSPLRKHGRIAACAKARSHRGMCEGTVASRHVRRHGPGERPLEFELPGDEAIPRREGDGLVIEPLPKRRLLDLLATWEPLAVAGADGRRTAGRLPMLPFRSGSSSGSDR